MNLRHYHRSNTEEYKRELQELNGLAQLPLLPRTRLTFPPEFAGKAIHHPIIYSHSQPLTKSEPLMKAGFKQLKQMFSGTDEHDHVLKWTADNIKHNDLQSFYLRNYKKNPKIHTTANKNKLGHINGMMDISSEMKNVKLTKDDTLESAFQKYDEVEKAWREGSGSRFIKPSTKTKPVVDFGDGWKWFDLGVAKSKNEGDAMGHCGNCGDPHKNDRILSLRKIVKVGNKTFHEPALTFINNEGWLGEMKGRANNKPHHKYHRRIVELLKHRDIKGIVGGGYQSENNFHFDDLSPEHKNQIKMSNPNFVDLKSGDWNHKQKLFAAGSVPRIQKYEQITNKIYKKNGLLNQIESGVRSIDQVVEIYPSEAAEYLKDHPSLNSQHIDKIVEKVPWAAAKYLNNHPLLNSQHIDKIVENEPGVAAVYFKDHPSLNSQHIDKIVENKPWEAAQYLNNHPLLNSQHIDKIVEKEPGTAALHLNNHPLLNSQHIDKIVEKAPGAAVVYLNNHPSLNSQHIDKIVENRPDAAAGHLKDHPYYIQKYGQQKIQKSFKQLKNEYERLTKANVDEINRFIEAHGYHLAAVKFKNDPNLNSQHIEKIVENVPGAAAILLKDHPLLNSQHIDKIVEKEPRAAAIHLKDHPLFNSQHIDKIVEKEPWAAAYYLKNHPLLNSQHIDKIVEKDPDAAARWLPNLNAEQVQYIIDKVPETAIKNLAPLFNQQQIDRFARHYPELAYDYLQDDPYYYSKYMKLNFSNNTEIFRKLRDTIQEQGGVVNAKDLPKLGFNENSLRINHLKDAKGNYTDTAIQQHIDNQSKHTYDISHTTWEGGQRHSDHGTQSVFQLNYTQEMEKQLKDAGVLDTFEAAHEASFNSNHPVRENTLGWVRYTKGSDGHIHIDEVQSDLGRNLHNVAQGQIEQAEREGQKLSPQEKERLLDLFSKEKIDKMNDILFKGHHPSKLLHEAFLQHLRNTGHVGKDIHIWQAMPKAKLAGQKTDIHLTNIDLQNFVDFHNKLQNNNIDDFFHDDNDGYEFTNDVVSGLLGDEQASNLYSKHFKNFDITESTPEERQNYINDFVKSKPYQMTLNHLNSHKNPHDSLNAALEHPSIKDKHIKLPFTHNDLPVHMKIGYHETPIRMGYEAGNYGNIETQENDKLKNQPTWKQPLRKSLKALTAEYERLQKAFEANGTWYPEQTDRLGLPHPVQKHLVVHRARNGKHVWSYHPELSRIFDRNLIQLMGGQKISTRNNIQLPNKITSLQKPTVSAIRGFAADLLKNPDRHVMSANTDPTKDRSHSEMRVRHLISALTGSDGYEIKDHSEGFEVYAPRHSKSQKAQEIATRWIYNASKKELRSERIYPTSPDGGNNNGKFGKSIRARSSSNTGRRYVDAGKSASSRPRSSKDIVGKTEAASKLKLLKAEDEAGMTAYPLKDGYSVHHETSQNGYDIWSIGHNGKRAGSFMICTDDTRRGRPFVSWAGVDNPHRGKGIGAAVYKTLAVHYGGLDSDRNSTSVDAIKAWRRAGGRQIKVKTAFGDYRYTLDGDKKRPPIVWNEDLEKGTQSNKNKFTNASKTQNMLTFYHGSDTLPIGKKPTKGGFLALDKEFAQNFGNTVHEFVFPSEKILDLRNKNHLEILKTKYPQSDIDFIKGSSQDLPNAFTHEQNATERLEKLKNMALSLGFHGTYQKESDWPNQPVSVEIYNTKHLIPKQNISKSEDLEKGARGDWEKEEGYKVHVNDDIHEPQAVVTHKGKKIGGLNTIKTPHGIKVSMVYVDPEHQRKGLATAMYQAVETKTKTKLIPSDKQTAQGQALWEQPNRQFGKSQTDANKLEKNKMNKSEDSSRVSSVVVVTNDKMLMLQRRDNNKWTFPGGHLNDTETHLEGAVRELWEEAGIKANPDEMILLGNKKTFENKDIYVYLYKINSEVNPSAANDPDKEAQKFAWLPHVLPEDIKENLYIPVGDNSSLSMFSVWLLRQKTNKLKELVKSKK